MTLLNTAPSRPRRLARAVSLPWMLAAVLGGLTIVAGVREGAFWPVDAFVVAVAALLILAFEVILERQGPRVLAVLGMTGPQ